MKMDCNIENCKSRCCHNCAVLTEGEVSILISNVRKKYFIELEPRKFFKEVKGELGTYYAIKMIKGQCIFLNKENRCRIYMCRPTLCELYPVVDIDVVDQRCPIANKLSSEALADLKRRYSEEINVNIKADDTNTCRAC